MTQPCPICGGRGEHYAPCADFARKPPFAFITRVTMDGDKLVYTQISVVEFHATTPTGER